MAFIPYLDESAIPESDRVPDTDHILRIHGVHPATMRHHYDLYVELMRRPGPLSRIQREMIAVSVSAANYCHYWVVHHGAGLRMLLLKDGRSEAETDALVEALGTDYRMVALPEADWVMLDYAIKLTHTPAAMTAEDVAKLKKAGFNDQAVHDICAVTAYFAFVNRIADGLGVELEPRFLTPDP